VSSGQFTVEDVVREVGVSLGRTDSGISSHRSHRRLWLLTLWLSVALVGLAGLGFGALRLRHHGRTPGCTGAPTTLAVSVAPAIAAAVSTLARQWSARRPVVEERCVAATVVPRRPEQVAAALGADWDPARDGVRPQVWIPDSSMWLAVAASRPDAATMLPTHTTSIASSPTVLALRAPMAQALGWPQRSLGWTDVIGAFSQPGVWAKVGHPEWGSLRVGITDPSRSTAGLASVLTILGQGPGAAGSASAAPAGGSPAAAGSGGGPATGAGVSNAQLTAGLALTRTLGAVAPDTDAFFAAQQASGAEAHPNAVVAVFPAMESDVAAYDATNPGVPLVPVYDTQQPVAADYPYTVLSASWVGATEREAAGQFLSFLLTPAAQAAIGEARLRRPDRSVVSPDALPAAAGFVSTVAAPGPAPDPATINAVIAEWANLQRQVNLLAVLDTSGSMTTAVPGTGMTRLQLLQQTATTGFGLLTNRTSIGLWDFSVKPGSTSEYRQLVPFGPLTADIGSVPRGQALPAAVATLQPSGFTPLYDTAYAAFHEMQRHWQPESSNAVLLITDGVNELNGGLSLAELLDRLRREQRADQPVQIVTIGLGTQADADALQQVAQVTGGRTYVVRDVATAIQTLILAFTGRLQ
jgi:Ca-activated chloride channel family protein